MRDTYIECSIGGRCAICGTPTAWMDQIYANYYCSRSCLRQQHSDCIYGMRPEGWQERSAV